MKDMEDYISCTNTLTVLNKYLDNRSHNHEEKVKKIALQLFDALYNKCGLSTNDRSLLAAAATFHDIGYFINKNDHHKHSSYIILNDKLFDCIPMALRNELAALCFNHRKNDICQLDNINNDRKRTLLKLVSLLRLADAASAKSFKYLNLDFQSSCLYLAFVSNEEICSKLQSKIEVKSTLFKEIFMFEIKILTFKK